MNTPPPGLMLPTVKSYVPGAGNPRDSALVSQQQMNESQNNLNKTVGGKKIRYKGGAENSEVVVPQFQMQYTPQGGPGTNPNDQITNMSSTSMQSTSWQVNDKLASKMGGGTRKRKRGSKKTKSRRKRTKSTRYNKRR